MLVPAFSSSPIMFSRSISFRVIKSQDRVVNSEIKACLPRNQRGHIDFGQGPIGFWFVSPRTHNNRNLDYSRIFFSLFLFFLDSFVLTYIGSSTPVTVPLSDTSIAWHSDKDVKFGNPKCKWVCLSSLLWKFQFYDQ